MKYRKAHDVLPDEIIEIIQEYIDGQYLYIPRKAENHKAWGEASGTKCNLKVRNSEIYQRHLMGITVDKLAQMYYLSEQSIRRILTQEKQCCS
ncbi:MAG: CD3324 family protein [Niameybacter sp.]|uniref:CD3324 family protein n=1 Tax=Niameybacter sp. TaxID=2033640 RepID=UPI002FC6173B